MSTDDLSVHERLSIQMEYAVPLVRDLQRILGAEVVNAALEERIRRNTEEALVDPAPAPDLRAMAAGVELYAAGDALEYEVLAADEERFDMNVTRCAYN